MESKKSSISVYFDMLATPVNRLILAEPPMIRECREEALAVLEAFRAAIEAYRKEEEIEAG